MIPDSKLVTQTVPAAANVTGASRLASTITLVVLHDAETAEVTKSALGSAHWFASGKSAGSAHYCCDPNEIVQCLSETRVSFGAKNANRQGVHIEQAGRAVQTAAQWDDSYSHAMIYGRVVPLVADICGRHKISANLLDVAALIAAHRAGTPWRGITTHANVTNACRALGLPQTGHTDPGGNYPIVSVIAAVRALLVHPAGKP